MPSMPSGWVYIMTNRPNGTLYLGVTNNLTRRVTQLVPILLYAEPHENMPSAIQRETSLKRWPRAWKVRLIVAGNSNWRRPFGWPDVMSWVAGTSPAMTRIFTARLQHQAQRVLDDRLERPQPFAPSAPSTTR